MLFKKKKKKNRSMVLTDSQRDALQSAVLEYLRSDERFGSTALEFSKALGLGENSTASKGTPILEKKWTSVVRLQRNVLTLEAKVKELESERAAGGFGGGNGGSGAGSSNGSLKAHTGGSFLVKSSAKCRLGGHRGPVSCVDFHPKFNILVSGSEDASLKLWDFESGDFERTLKGHTNVVHDCVFNSDGTLLATCSADMSIKLWDFSGKSNDYACIKTLMGHDHSVTGVTFLSSESSSTQIASCSRDKTIKIWDTNSGYCLKTLSGHSEWVRKVCVDAGSGMLASGSSDHNVIVWNPMNNNPLVCTLVGHEHVVECVAFASKVAETHALGVATIEAENASKGNTTKVCEILVSGSRDRTIKVWQVSSASCLFTLNGHENWVRGVRFQPQGRYLLSVAEDKSIKMWDLKERRCVRTITPAHKHFLTSLAIHPRLAVIATTSVDQEIGVWLAAPNST